MPELDDYFDRLDSERVSRVRELTSIKRSFGFSGDPSQATVHSKATVVLCYAVWEGFYNECVSEYCGFLKANGGKVKRTDWLMLLGVIGSDLESLKARNHSNRARFEFVRDLKSRLESEFDQFDVSYVRARSNLDFERLSLNYNILSFDLSPFQRHRIRLDKELVGWRNSVAHGEEPDLSGLDIANHVDFTSELLIVLADAFQEGMLKRI